jgi:uncharacterized membrane protein
MRSIIGIIFFVSLLSTVILFFVSFCNYLIHYQLTGVQIIGAYKNNVYVSYWVNLMSVFVLVAIISFVIFIFTKPKVIVGGENMYSFENKVAVGNGVADEYVTVRIKKDELSKINN